MKDYMFDEIIDKKMTGSVKWDGLKDLYGAEELIPMWVADMDVRPADSIVGALTKRIAHGHFGYSLFEDRAKQAIQNWFLKRYDQQIEQSSLLYSSGVVPALAHSLLALTDEHDEVIIQTPVYPPFHQIIQSNNRTLIENPLRLIAGRYEIDFLSLEAQMKTAKMMILCSPHNPTGRVFNRSELETIVDLAKKYDVYLLSDEIHADLIFSGNKHHPISAFSYEKAILVSAPSKTFNIPGLYASYLVVPNETIRLEIERVQQANFVHPNALASTAIIAAYEDKASEQWLDQLLLYLEQNRDHALRRIETEMPLLSVVKPDATFLLWIDFERLGLTEDDRATWLVERASLALTHGKAFGTNGVTFERLNFGCPRRQLDEALDQLHDAYLSLM